MVGGGGSQRGRGLRRGGCGGEALERRDYLDLVLGKWEYLYLGGFRVITYICAYIIWSGWAGPDGLPGL